MAFPSAYGAGAYTSGARGGVVLHVTSLNDDINEVGTLTWCLEHPTNRGIDRTIVFDVSGVIEITQATSTYSSGSWTRRLDGTNGFTGSITINGFTAPEGGITIIGYSYYFLDMDNIIIRGVKFRNGYPDDNGASNLQMRRCTNVIVDKCSFSYGNKGININSDSNTIANVTIQNNLIGEAQQGALIGNSNGDEIPAGDWTFARNVIGNVRFRMPKIGGQLNLDLVNNIYHNWDRKAIRANGNSYTINIYSNYWQRGIDYDNAFDPIFTTFTNTEMSPRIYDDGLSYFTSDLSDDYGNYPNPVSDVWSLFNTSTYPIQSWWFESTPTPMLGRVIPIIPTANLKTELLPTVGACYYINNSGQIVYSRDSVDSSLVDKIDNDSNEGRINGSLYQSLAEDLIITTPNNTRPSDFYQSNPHIPETWLISRGIAGTPTIHNEIQPSGYTLLEEYMYQVDNTEPVPSVDVTGVDVTPETAEILIPDTIALTATITPSNATDQSGVWTSSNDAIATVDSNGVVIPLTVGEVTITFTSNDNPDYFDSSIITVLPEAFEANAGPDQTICQGESVVLSASGGLTYLWSNGETTDSIEVNPTITTIYTVTAFDGFGNSDDDTVTVNVNDLPTAEAGDDQTICEGDSTTLSASGGEEYLWSTGETTDSISVIPSVDTTYTVEVISNGCSSTDEVNVFVNPLPNITVSNDVTIMDGETTTLTVSGSDNYLWSTGETSESIEVSPTVTTTYTVSTTSVNGCTSNAEITVTVIPELVAEAGEDVEICNGEEIVLIASGGINYTWNTGETSSQITVSPNTTTTYTVTVEDNFGNSDSDSVVVSVIELPNLSVSSDITIMEGESTTISATGADNYLWSTGETTNIIEVTPTVTTTYTVTSSNGNCEDTKQVIVTVIPELVADAGEDIEICDGEEIVLTASGGVSYAWNTGETTEQITVNPNTTTIYTVTVEDSFGNSDSDSVTVIVNSLPTLTITEDLIIVEGESIQLNVSGADTYLWSTGETSDAIIVTPNSTTTYTVLGTTATCTAETQVIVTVEELLVVSAGEDENVCENSGYEVVLTSSPGDSYLWSTGATTQSIAVSPLSTTTYTVTVSSGIQEDTDDVTVFVNPNPDVVILNGESVDIMNGDFVTLSASGANTYEWNNGATQPNIAVSPSQTTTYEVRGYIGDCYDEKQVTVNVIPEVEADAGEDQEICLGDIVTLTATGGDGSEYEYEWSTGENTQSIQVSPTETTEYTVTVFSSLIDDFDEDTVTVFVDNNCDDGGVVEDPIDEPVDGTALDFNFSVYPNPATEYVDIKLSGSNQLTGFYLYDITGKLIYQKRIENESSNVSSTTRVDVSNLRPGIYLVKLADIQRELYKRLIVR